MTPQEKEKLILKIEKTKKQRMDLKVKRQILKIIRNNPKAEITVRIKSKTSALEKVDKRSYQKVEELKDMIGVMIIVEHKKQIYEIKEKLEKSIPNAITKDYIENPKKGYRSIHINYVMDNQWVESIPVEIQIKTKSMKRAQDLLHNRIYKNNMIPEKLKTPIYQATFQIVIIMEQIKNQCKKIGKKIKRKSCPISQIVR